MLTNYAVKEIAVQIGDVQFTAKDAHVRQVETKYGYPIEGTVEVNISLIVSAENLSVMQKLVFDDFSPKKISQKKVKDCTIQELLFAAREKVKRGEK